MARVKVVHPCDQSSSHVGNEFLVPYQGGFLLSIRIGGAPATFHLGEKVLFSNNFTHDGIDLLDIYIYYK